MMQLSRVRSDAMPEYANWRDTGCDVSPKCVECPLEVCKYEMTAIQRNLHRKGGRNRAIAELHREGTPVDEIAKHQGISRRTVYRILAVMQK